MKKCAITPLSMLAYQIDSTGAKWVLLIHVPFKVSTTASNFMMGVTTAAGAVVYLQRGYIQPGLALYDHRPDGTCDYFLWHA